MSFIEAIQYLKDNFAEGFYIARVVNNTEFTIYITEFGTIGKTVIGSESYYNYEPTVYEVLGVWEVVEDK